MNFKTLLEALSSVIVALIALAMLVLYVNDRGSAARDMDPGPVHVQDWQDWHVDGIRRGPEDAPMVVAAFTDFRCPYCRRLAPVLDSLMDLFPDQVAVEHFHFPLAGHDKAVPASMASECAERQMVFGEMYRILFAQLDSTGLRSWSALAADAGVRDLEAFEECMKLPIDKDRQNKDPMSS